MVYLFFFFSKIVKCGVGKQSLDCVFKVAPELERDESLIKKSICSCEGSEHIWWRKAVYNSSSGGLKNMEAELSKL